MDSIFVTGYSSLIESRINKLNLGTRLRDTKYIVDKIITNLIDKVLLVTLPINLSKFHGKIISRVPLKTSRDYELKPYQIPEVKSITQDQDYSLLILNKYLMNSLDNLEELDQIDFLLGTDSIHEGYLTSIGYKLLMTDLDRFNNN